MKRIKLELTQDQARNLLDLLYTDNNRWQEEGLNDINKHHFAYNKRLITKIMAELVKL